MSRKNYIPGSQGEELFPYQISIQVITASWPRTQARRPTPRATSAHMGTTVRSVRPTKCHVRRARTWTPFNRAQKQIASTVRLGFTAPGLGVSYPRETARRDTTAPGDRVSLLRRITGLNYDGGFRKYG